MEKYITTKSIRFKLKKIHLAEEFEKNAQTKDFTGEEVGELSRKLRKIKADFAGLFFYKSFPQEENQPQKELLEDIVFRKKWEVKYGWLRNYTKNDFYNWKEKRLSEEKPEKRRYETTEVDYLKKEFIRWANEWEELCFQLDNLLSQPDEKQNRHRNFAFVISGFQKRSNFEFIREFSKAICGTNDPKIDDELELWRDGILETEKLLKKCEAIFLPSQSAGLQIAKASFNYYTLNKAPKIYTDEILNLKKSLDQKVSHFERRDGAREFISSNKIVSSGLFLDVSLDQAYRKVKKWKAEQKNEFLEAVQKKVLTAGNFGGKFPLFSASEKDLENFLELTDQIEILATRKNNEKNKKRKKESAGRIKELREKRGYFFNSPDNLDIDNNQIIITENYFELCDLYKKIAQKRGQFLARIKGLEYEKTDSQKLQYWSLILEENGKHYLLLVSRGYGDNHKKAKEYIEKNLKSSTGETTVYHFKSLTLRALWKLCFKSEKNTFFPCIAKELGLYGKEINDVKIRGAKHLLKANFYQDVLKTKSARNSLDIFDFGNLPEVLEEKYDKLEDFESDLEKTCYVRIALKINSEEKEKFIEKFNASIFEISSYDLRIKQEGKRGVIEKHQDKKHTEDWQNFWRKNNESEKYPIRLNPEINIFWREPAKKLETKIANKEILGGKILGEFRNRLSMEQFTLQTTMSFNATEKKTNLAFKTTQDIKRHIDKFNDSFNKNFKGVWHYGIDRGQEQLATLCLAKFSDEKNEFGLSKLEESAKIEAWKLKDENYAEEITRKDGTKFTRKAISNVSYFTEREKLFEKTESACLDLTMAKLIGGKIVLNGDKITYLKLKYLSAKRKLWKLFSLGKIGKESSIKYLCPKNCDTTDWKNAYGLEIIAKDGKAERFYWFTDEQIKEERLKQEIVNSLNKYLAHLSKTSAVEYIGTAEKINHLRDSITANMVGIIAHLQKSYPGVISLENMDSKEHIKKHFQQTNQNVSRRLEWALYRKFQEQNLIPPQIKQTVFLRDEFSVYQFGIIKFVKIEETSKSCPRCGTINNKKRNGRVQYYVCKNRECGFNSENNRRELGSLNDSDRVAAYNIAKNAFDNIYSK